MGGESIHAVVSEMKFEDQFGTFDFTGQMEETEPGPRKMDPTLPHKGACQRRMRGAVCHGGSSDNWVSAPPPTEDLRLQ
jgi:hypothetical protein